MVFDLGTRLLLHFASFFALGSPILDLLIRPLRRSISEIMDLQLTNQIAVFVTTIISVADWEKGSFGIRRSKVSFCMDLLHQPLHYLNPRGGSPMSSI